MVTILSRYYIKGEHEGKSEVFAQNLPGMPDNIRLSSKGGYWVGFASIRTDVSDLMTQYPRARRFIAKVGNCYSIVNGYVLKVVTPCGYTDLYFLFIYSCFIDRLCKKALGTSGQNIPNCQWKFILLYTNYTNVTWSDWECSNSPEWSAGPLWG